MACEGDLHIKLSWCTCGKRETSVSSGQAVSWHATAGKIFKHLKGNLRVFGQQTKLKTNSGSVKVLAVGHLGHSDGCDV